MPSATVFRRDFGLSLGYDLRLQGLGLIKRKVLLGPVRHLQPSVDALPVLGRIQAVWLVPSGSHDDTSDPVAIACWRWDGTKPFLRHASQSLVWFWWTAFNGVKDGDATVDVLHCMSRMLLSSTTITVLARD